MGVFDIFAEYQYKKRKGDLTEKESFIYGFIIGICIVVVLKYYDEPIFGIKRTNLKKLYVAIPFILGTLNIITNSFTKHSYSAKIKNYKNNGFTEKEAKEQALADSRQYTGDTMSTLIGSRRR